MSAEIQTTGGVLVPARRFHDTIPAQFDGGWPTPQPAGEKLPSCCQ